MFSENLIQLYILAFVAWVFYPDLAQPPLSYLSTFFLIQNILFLAIVLMYLVMLKDFEREIGTGHFVTLYLLGGILGNLGLLSIAFGTESAIPISGATAGIFCIFGAFVSRHPYDLTITEGLPMVTILSLVFLTLGHIILFGKMDFLPILAGVVYGYWLPANPLARPRPKYPARRY